MCTIHCTMQKIKTFFRSFFNSFNPSYYSDVVRVRASFSWKYLLMLCLVSSLVITTVVGWFVVKFNPQQVADQVVQIYPQELIVTVENGQLSVNQSLPYRVPLKFDMFGMTVDSDLIDQAMEMEGEAIHPEFDGMPYLVTFTTDDAVKNVQDFFEQNSMVVLTESTVYAFKDTDTGEVSVYPIPDTEDPILVDQSVVNEIKNMILDIPFIKHKLYVPSILVAVLILVFVGLFISRLLMIVVFSLVTTVLAALFLKDKKLPYGKMVQVGFHSITPIMVLAYLDDLFKIHVIEGWIYFFMFVGWTLFVVSKTEPKASDKKTVVSKADTSTAKKSNKKKAKSSKNSSATKKSTSSKKKK